MIDKHIIINGVDVSKCEAIDNDSGWCSFWEENCAKNPDCIHKKYLRKEQECEELKKRVCGLRPELKYIIDKTCCQYNINAKYYHEKIVEIINNLDKYKETLIEIKKIAEFYANSTVGDKQEDGTFKVDLEQCTKLGTVYYTYDPRPANQILQKISEVINEKV